MMTLVKGAPPELVKIWNEWVEAEAAFKSCDHNRADLERHARTQGFASWSSMRARAVANRSMLERLLHRQEMAAVWKVLKAETPIQGTPFELYVYRQLELSVNAWFSMPLLSPVDRQKGLAKISSTAKQLIRALRPFELGVAHVSDMLALIGNERSDAYRRFLHPDIVASMDKLPGLAKAIVSREFVPPLSELLARLADNASNWGGRAPVTKIGSKTAFRTFLIRRMLFPGLMTMKKGYTHEFAARFFCVALDDPNVTAETVRAAHRNIMRELSA